MFAFHETTAGPQLSELRVSIGFEERAGIDRHSYPLRIGIPLAKGQVRDCASLVVCNSRGEVVAHQLRPLAFWSDRSCKWVLVDALVSCRAGARDVLTVRAALPGEATEPARSDSVTQEPDGFSIDTGPIRFRYSSQVSGFFPTVALDGNQLIKSIRIADAKRPEWTASIDEQRIEERGPVLVTVHSRGRLQHSAGGEPIDISVRAHHYVCGLVRLDLLVHNTRPARHLGGLWDLGDRGSVFFEDLSIELVPSQEPDDVLWWAENPAALERSGVSSWKLFQASSGGEHWNSPNHVDGSGMVVPNFRGYEIQFDGHRATGHRAQPMLGLNAGPGRFGATVEGFWQNFPKALRWDGRALSVGLFPSEQRSRFELQGGEQKRHTVWLEFSRIPDPVRLAELHQPLAVWIDPASIERSGAVSSFIPQEKDPNGGYLDYVSCAVSGPQSFFAKREVIDEFGWRNFGDLYADHEAVGQPEEPPFVSHYNNQYDFVYGGLIHYLRSSDNRWFELASDSARHTTDIDIYHTLADKPAFSGGMFWHTDHYKHARTCTHRTYSRHNATGGSYGGGPSNEHNYTSGLLLFHYLTGDIEARNAVVELADWVVRMDDGSLTLLAPLSSRPTGDASKTRSEAFHGPGRGAGNSINALLDAYLLTAKRMYLIKAEELVQRCIHPHDDIARHALDDPENRWSYLVFLQVLGKFLETKNELGEIDYAFQYARASLLHYARWMLANERPYKELLHKVEIPTETWPAHDIRKCHVLHIASRYCETEEAERFRSRAAFFFERCLSDVLEFQTAYLTRPLVLLIVYGYVHSYYMEHRPRANVPTSHNYDFGAPAQFVSQRSALGADLRARMRIVRTELIRLVRDKSYTLRARLRRRVP